MTNLRVVFVPALELSVESFIIEANSLQEAVVISNTISDYTLFLHNLELMHDYSNMAYIEMYDEEEKAWVDWYDEASDLTDPEEYLEYLKETG